MERRTFLVLGAAAVGLAGCTRGSVEPSPPGEPAPSTAPADPDSRFRDEVAASEVALIAAYGSAISAHPEFAADLAPFLAHHEQHLARVAPGFDGGSGKPMASTSPSESDPRSESSSTTPEETSAPSATDALAGLAAAESQAQAQRAKACDGAQDPGLARDLCLIAASEAQHAVALDALAMQGSGS